MSIVMAMLEVDDVALEDIPDMVDVLDMPDMSMIAVVYRKPRVDLGDLII